MNRRIKIILFLLVVPFSFSRGVTCFDLRSLIGGVTGADRGVGLLLTGADFRKNQLPELEKERAILDKRAEEASKTIENRLRSIDEEMSKTNEEIKTASGSHEELVKKKLEILNERKQNQLNFKDLWKEVDGKIARHIELLNGIIDYFGVRKEPKPERSVYSWQDLDEAKSKSDQLSAEVASGVRKKDRLNKLKDAEKEEISILQKEIDTKKAEKEKVNEEYTNLSEQEEIFALELRAKISIFDQEINYSREKIEVAQFKQESLEREEGLKEDEIFLLKEKLNQLNGELSKIQKKLRIDSSDVSFAKDELDKATAAANMEKSNIARTRSRLKLHRDNFSKRIDFFEKQLARLKEAGKEKSVEGYISEGRLTSFKSEKRALDRELDLIDTRKDMVEIAVQLRWLRSRVITVLHDLGISVEKMDDWFEEFRAKKRSAEHAQKMLGDRRDEITSYLSGITIAKEGLISKRKEIEDLRGKIFEGNDRAFVEVLSLFKSASDAIERQKIIIEKHFSYISQLHLKQGELINGYNFIISYLETHWEVGIWKRSPRAISLKSVGQALFEIETFFKKLFWDTPFYLNPMNLFAAIKGLSSTDIIGLLLFFLFFIVLFFVCKYLLLFVRKRIGFWISRNSLVTGVESLINFVLNHFLFIFTWLFLFLHIALDVSYFKPFMQPYILALFFLVSIPLLALLAHRFVLRLRTLNEQLNFLFISEKSQFKVTFLLEVFLFATAIILPLRQAFLEYFFDKEIAFSVVSLAAYTLIFVVTLVFLVNKEDLINLFLSSPSGIVVWLKKRVERYYYPVFGFIISLLILINPYVGYWNLAWYLIFAVPASLFLLWGIFVIHHFIRKYSLFLFIREEDDEVVNKFEHAKAYYGLFVAISFIAISLVAFVLFARLWGFEEYTLASLWKSLSEDWVIRIGPKEKLGFVELIKFGMFLAGGLVISSLIKKFILHRLYDIFRTEPGVQNTVSKILHYLIIILAVILGFTAINLSQYALTVGGLLLVGVGFGMRDQIADYFAGVLVLLERPIELGHFVEAGEHTGKVHHISARSTTLRTARNLFVIIPNRDIISKPIINWGKGRYAVGCELQIMVSYDSDAELVKSVLQEVIKAHQMVLRVPPPVVRFEGFEESSIYFYCRCFVSSRKVLDMWELQSDLRTSIMKVFKENNIVIPYPQTVIHMADKCSKNHPDDTSLDTRNKLRTKDERGPSKESRTRGSAARESAAPGSPIKITFDKE